MIGKRKEELQELLTLEGYTENDELENGAAKTHDLRLFTYASIQSATRNFSLKHKLGQGGFGPVYKAILLSTTSMYLLFAILVLLSSSNVYF